MHEPQKLTAAAIIIGNEILTGKIPDKNSYFLAQTLFERGVWLKKVVIIPDELEIIGQTANSLSNDYDVVITSGGIGPTHDDITYEALAQGFGLSLSYHQETLQKMQKHYKAKYPNYELNHARKRMAYLPYPCKILSTKDLWVPIVVIKNVYVLAGVPELFAQMLNSIKENFTCEKIHRITLITNKPEGDFAEELDNIQKQYKSINIGSYPKNNDNKYEVLITLEGYVLEELNQVKALLEKIL